MLVLRDLQFSAIFAVVHRPGSSAVADLFFSEFSDLLERIAVSMTPVFVVGDLNIYLDVVDDAAALKLSNILSTHSLTQHITQPGMVTLATTVQQSSRLRKLLQHKASEYWSTVVSSCNGDSMSLWTKINVLLKPPTPASSASLSADDFTTYFTEQVNSIRSATAGAPPPVIDARTDVDRL